MISKRDPDHTSLEQARRDVLTLFTGKLPSFPLFEYGAVVKSRLWDPRFRSGVDAGEAGDGGGARRRKRICVAEGMV